jgi:3'-phosphoadenosine 5'-phosphosulfate sulfotransferase (PAPS reductase)/FAD synthetase
MSEMLRVVQFSGGKDSTALVLWAREQFGVDGFTAVFCDTGWEHELTYSYIAHINDTVLAGRLVTIRNEKIPGGMVELVRKKGMVPRSQARFCTEHLKIVPFVAWRKTVECDDMTVYQGIRADESRARSQMPRRVWNDPMDAWIERPLFDWTAEQVFEQHRKHGVEPNPLYKAGSARVGCFPCIMANHGEWRRIDANMPDVWDRAKQLEDAANDGRANGACKAAVEAGSVVTFFRPGFIPERFCTGGGRDGAKLPTVDDVRKYITEADEQQASLFDACTPGGCMSVYNLCE